MNSAIKCKAKNLFLSSSGSPAYQLQANNLVVRHINYIYVAYGLDPWKGIRSVL